MRKTIQDLILEFTRWPPPPIESKRWPPPAIFSLREKRFQRRVDRKLFELIFVCLDLAEFRIVENRERADCVAYDFKQMFRRVARFLGERMEKETYE